jgi:hypothetical protein
LSKSLAKTGAEFNPHHQKQTKIIKKKKEKEMNYKATKRHKGNSHAYF